MNLLLDTHAVLWFITEDPQLPVRTKKLIENAANNCLVSIASLWEIGIKSAVGKLALHADLEIIFQIIHDSGFEILPVTPDHILVNAKLPLLHADPFDRIIIAQSLEEDLVVVTKDKIFRHYTTTSLWQI